MAKTTNKLTAAAVSPMADMKWRAEEDLRTLTRAKEIERDRARMKAAKSCAREQIKSLANVTGGNRKK